MKSLNFLHFLLCVCIANGCTRRPVDENIAQTSNRLIGAWRLVSWESIADGKSSFPFGDGASGLLVYTDTGHMFVFLSQPNREPFSQAEAKAGTAAEKVAAFDACFAYAGTFVVDEERVIHRVEQCTFPNWIGTEQVRSTAGEI